MLENIKKNWLYYGFAISLLATVGSLYFSEIANFPPCVLCWYQRALMYPLVAIFGYAIYYRNAQIAKPAWLLAAIGWLIGFYHNLLYYKILPEAAAPCEAGVSCTTKYIEWFGFITIPLLSLLGFSAILILLIINYRNNSSND